MLYMLLYGGGPAFLGTIFGGGFLAGLISLAWRFWRNEQEESLISAFRNLSGGDLDVRVSVGKAVGQAGLQDPSPVLDRLRRKGHIVVCYRRPISEVPPADYLTDKDLVDPDYFAITFEGRDRAERERPPLLQRVRQG